MMPFLFFNLGPRKCGNLTTTPASSPNTTQSTGNSSKNLFQLSKQRIPRNPCQLCLIISAELSKDPTIKTKVCQNCNILLSFSDSVNSDFLSFFFVSLSILYVCLSNHTATVSLIVTLSRQRKSYKIFPCQ